MKAILGVAAAAERLDRAESARRRGLRCRATVEEDEDDHADEGRERCERPVPAMATTLLSPRLLDQRLDEGLDLLAFERRAVASLAALARADEAGRQQSCLPPLQH